MQPPTLPTQKSSRNWQKGRKFFLPALCAKNLAHGAYHGSLWGGRAMLCFLFNSQKLSIDFLQLGNPPVGGRGAKWAPCHSIFVHFFWPPKWSPQRLAEAQVSPTGSVEPQLNRTQPDVKILNLWALGPTIKHILGLSLTSMPLQEKGQGCLKYCPPPCSRLILEVVFKSKSTNLSKESSRCKLPDLISLR